MPAFDPNKSHPNVIIEIILLVLGTTFAFSSILCISFLIYDPRGAIFLGELVPEQYFYFPIRFAIILYHAYIIVVLHTCSAVVCFCVLIYAFYITPIYIRELRLGRKKYTTLHIFRESANIRHVYRSIQVLHINAFCVFGVYLVICNAHFMCTCLYCNFVLIRYWSELQTMSRVQLVMWAIMLMGVWCFVMEWGRYFFARGSKVLGSWKGDKWGSIGENVLMKKFRLSCKPILLCYGRQFVIRRVSVLIFCRGVVRRTFRALLTTKR